MLWRPPINKMADKQRLGLRAITMQQPFAAAMAAGVGLYTRRGKSTKFAEGGEWIAIHCGQNEEHLKNAALMKEIRRVWPACPTDAALKTGHRSVLGIAHFVDGNCDAKTAAASDTFLANYDCCKPAAWRADSALACDAPMAYPKGNLQVWHLQTSGFERPSEGALLLQMARGTTSTSSKVKIEVKVEEKEVKQETKSAKKRSSQRTEEDSAGGKRSKTSTKAKREEEGEWLHYGNGGWNTFSPAATAWLFGPAAAQELVEEQRGHAKKPASQRRIRLQPDDEPASWRFFLISASLMAKLKGM